MDMKLGTVLMVGLAFVGGLSVVGALAAFAGVGGLTGSLAGETVPGQNQEQQDQNSITMVQAQGTGVDFSATMPTNIGSGTLYLFQEEPETQAPTHFGDYVDFDASEATSGLTEGEDYEQVSLSSTDSATLQDLADTGSLGPGTYTAVLVDSSSPRDYHYLFGSVEVPEKVAKYKVEQGISVDITPQSGFDQFPSYLNDETVTVDQSGTTVSLSADLDDPSSNVTDRVRTVERSIEHSSGVDYLGPLVAENFNTGDGVSEVTARLVADGEQVYSKTLYDGSTDEFGSDNSYTEDLLERDLAEEPLKSSDEVSVEFEVTYDYSTLSSSSDDGDISDGETILDFRVEDIYGNTVGSAGTTSITG